MAEKPGLKAKLAVGGLILGSGALVIYNLFFRPKPTVQVTLTSNPIRTILLVDDKYEVATPRTITLQKGKHKFSAVHQSPNLLITYGFDRWILNKRTISYAPTAEVNITQPSVLTAHYMMIEAGIYPIVPT